MTFDVTPKEYGDRFGMSERTAQQFFCRMLSEGKIFIRRVGLPSRKYPDGKLLRMERDYFTGLYSPTPSTLCETNATSAKK
jgi:hypothetical protein